MIITITNFFKTFFVSNNGGNTISDVHWIFFLCCSKSVKPEVKISFVVNSPVLKLILDLVAYLKTLTIIYKVRRHGQFQFILSWRYSVLG